jgi:hypothetical protein
MDFLGIDPTDPLAIFETQSYDERDFVELLSKNRTEKEWDEIMERLLPDLNPVKEKFPIKIIKLDDINKGYKRKSYSNGLNKYKHTPKWYKKKNLQELELAFEYLKKEDSWMGKCVRCESY